MSFELDQRLAADSYQLGDFDDSLLLLSKNALFPWFILVPKTQEIEYHKLSAEQHANIQQQINTTARFIEAHFPTDKINIASIGNIVSQLHIHIIGRNQNDACWPGVVWGTEQFKAYEEETTTRIRSWLKKSFNNGFQVMETRQETY